jgi:hypothetical protein
MAISKHNDICLYFATTCSLGYLIKKYELYNKTFSHLKYSKHKKQGKTTKRRKGNVESRLAISRNAVHSLSKIIYYKKNMLNDKMVVDLPEDFTYDKSLYEFLNNC